MGVLTPSIRSLDVSDVTFACPDPAAFRRLDEPGPEVAGRRLGPDRAVPARRVVGPGQWCRRCGCEGVPRDSAIRRPAHEPFGWRPVVLEAALRRHRCTGCGRAWRQDAGRAAEPRAEPSRRGLRWALEGVMHRHPTAAHVDEGPGRQNHRGNAWGKRLSQLDGMVR